MNSQIPRMRTIKQCVEHFKAADPDTAITEYFIRTLANSNEISTVRAGNKIMIDLDILTNYLKGGKNGNE